MGDTVEVVKALVSPCEKLIDAVQAAIGKAYEPHYVKKMAEAKAHEIAVIGEAMRESCDIPISYDKSDIVMDTTNWEQFVNRTQSRLAFQELKKQENIEAVILQAYYELEGETEVSNDPIDSDWLLRFFNSVKDVGTEEVRNLWVKILAGETKLPGTVSLRTMAMVQNISKEEARLFQRVLPLVLKARRNDYFLVSDSDILRKYNIHYDDLLVLDECGLVMSSHSTMVLLSAADEDEELMRSFRSKKHIVRLHDPLVKQQRVALSIYPLTKAGKELANILCVDSNDDWVFDVAESVAKKTGITATVHRFHGLSGYEVIYESEELAKF